MRLPWSTPKLEPVEDTREWVHEEIGGNDDCPHTWIEFVEVQHRRAFGLGGFGTRCVVCGRYTLDAWVEPA